MSESDTTSGSVPGSEGSTSFDELMRLERKQNRPPVSGLAVGALAFAVAFAGLAFFFGVFTLVVGAASLIFAVFAVPQIRHRERRGSGFVLAALVVLALGVIVIENVLSRIDQLVP